jgi:hypothetical protein
MIAGNLCGDVSGPGDEALRSTRDLIAMPGTEARHSHRRSADS